MFFKLILISLSLLVLSGSSLDNFTSRLNQQASALKKFAKQHGYNDQLAFLVDMIEGSGLARFVIYNLANNSIEKTGLVTHGRCNKLWLYPSFYICTPKEPIPFTAIYLRVLPPVLQLQLLNFVVGPLPDYHPE